MIASDPSATSFGSRFPLFTNGSRIEVKMLAVLRQTKAIDILASFIEP